MGFSRVLVLLVAAALVAVGCGGDDDDASPGSSTADESASEDGGDVAPGDEGLEDQPAEAGDDGDSVPAEQASPEAVVEAYFEAADANAPGAMFALISPKIREEFTLARFTACVSDQLADISGADVAFEHLDTYVEDGSTFVEAMITLSEQGEGAVPSDDLEVVEFPAVLEAVEIDGLWWTAGDKGGDAIFSCAREGIDEAGPAGSNGSGEDDRGPVVEEEWSIALHDEVAGIYTVVMIKTFSPLEEADIEDLGGRLVWDETEIELCRIGIRSVGDGFVQIGDIFQTTEGCEANTGMQQAFDDFGPPQTACVYVRVGGVDDEHCAPLTVGTAEVEEDFELEEPSLVGVWTGTEVGRPTDPWTFVFDERDVSAGSAGAEIYQGTYVVFPDEEPRRMEFAVAESMVPEYVGETAQAIYRFDGTTLILASNEPGVADTPTEFSPGGGTRVWELTRR